MTEMQLFLAVVTTVVSTTLAVAAMMRWAIGNLRELFIEKIRSVQKGVDKINGSVADHESRLRELERRAS